MDGVLSTGKKGIIGAGNCQQRAGPGRRTAAALPTNTIAKNAMACKGKVGTVEYSGEDGCLFGRIVGIRDIITYKGENVTEI